MVLIADVSAPENGLRHTYKQDAAPPGSRNPGDARIPALRSVAAPVSEAQEAAALESAT